MSATAPKPSVGVTATNAGRVGCPQPTAERTWTTFERKPFDRTKSSPPAAEPKSQIKPQIRNQKSEMKNPANL